MQVRWWSWWAVVVVVLSWAGTFRTPTHALTLDGYFKVITLAAKKRDVWRKIFLGKDIGFDVSPWLFEDRVKPPVVPIKTSFPRYPVYGHYRNERGPAFPPEPITTPTAPEPPASIHPTTSCASTVSKRRSYLHLPSHSASTYPTHTRRRKGRWFALPRYLWLHESRRPYRR